MNTGGFDADRAASIQRTVKKIKQISTWAVAALTLAGAVFAYWSVTSEEEEVAKAKRKLQANDHDDSDDGGDEGGSAPSTVETASSKTEEATAVEATTVVQAVNTPGSDDTPEPEGPGEWVTALLGLKDDEYGPDMTDENEMQETQAFMMMNQLAALQEVLTGTKKQELTQLVEMVQANQGNQQVFQMLQTFAAGAQQELSAGEQEKCKQVFFQLQLQQAQSNLQLKILEKTKALIFAALPAEMQSQGQALQERLSEVQEECNKLEQGGEAEKEKSRKLSSEISVEFFTKLANLEATVTGADKDKLQQDKNMTVYTENMKLARFQFETDCSTIKQEKLIKMAQENEALMMFMIEKQQAMMTEQDPESQMRLQMTLPIELEAEVCKKPKRKAKFLKWYAEVRTERATFWRDRMLEQQIAYERNELRVQLMDEQQRQALRTKQVEQQHKLMQGQLNTLTEAEMNKELESDLAPHVKQDLEDQCLRRKRELEAKFLPASERGNTEARDITDKTSQVMSEYSARFIELKNDPEALKQEHAKMLAELAQLTSGAD